MEEVSYLAIAKQYITPLAISGSSLLAATFAAISIRSSRNIVRKKNAIDLVFEYNNEDSVQEGLGEIRRIHLSPKQNVEDYAYKERQGEDSAVHLNQVLNYFEFVAVGVKEGIYDENILKRSFYSSFTNCFGYSKKYIYKLRETYERDTILQEFEYLAKRWKSKPLKVNKTNGKH